MDVDNLPNALNNATISFLDKLKLERAGSMSVSLELMNTWFNEEMLFYLGKIT